MKYGLLTKAPSTGKSTLTALLTMLSATNGTTTYVTETQEDTDARRIRNFVGKAKQNGLAEGLTFDYIEAAEFFSADFEKWKPKGLKKGGDFNFFVDGHGDMENGHLQFFADYVDTIIVPHSYSQRKKSWRLLASTLDCLKEADVLHKVKVVGNFGASFNNDTALDIHFEEMRKVTDRWDDVQVNLSEDGYIAMLADGFEEELDMGINPYMTEEKYIKHASRLTGDGFLGGDLTDELTEVFNWLLND